MDDSERNGQAGEPVSAEISQAPEPRNKAAHLAAYRWRPGSSPNPGGRSRSPDMVLAKARALAKESSIEALATLVAIMRTARDDKLRAWTAVKVIDIAGEVGTAKTSADLQATERGPRDVRELERVFERFSREAMHALARTGLEGASVTLDVTPNRGEETVPTDQKVSQSVVHPNVGAVGEGEVPGTPPGRGGIETGTPRVGAEERSDSELEAKVASPCLPIDAVRVK